MMSDACRETLEGQKGVRRRSDDLVFAAEFNRQPMESTQQRCYMVSFSFL